MKQILKWNNKVIGKIDNGSLIKLVKEKNLLFKFGGVPALDADAWDSNKEHIRDIEIITDKKNTFYSSKDNFEENKKSVDFGWGKQYYLELNKWN